MASIIYITRINFFSDKAHVHTIAKTCEALAERPGIRLTLVSTDNSLLTKGKRDEFFVRHAVAKTFPVVSLDSCANKWKDKSNFFMYNMSTVWANFSLIGFLFRTRRTTDVVYFRDHLILPAVLFAKYILGKKVVYESHYILTKRFGQWLADRSAAVSNGVVAIAHTLRDYYLQYNQNIIVSSCASAEKIFPDIPSLEFKRKLSLPEDGTLLVYTGNIDVTGNADSYGVEDIVAALPCMMREVPGLRFLALGKKTSGDHALEALARRLNVPDRFICLPWVARENVPKYISAADILVIPHSGNKPGNSPTKMFEYLPSHRPIVAARTRAIAEVLHDGDNALLVSSDDPTSWAEAVVRLVNDPAYAKQISDQAYHDADQYTWAKRGKDIGEFVGHLV